VALFEGMGRRRSAPALLLSIGLAAALTVLSALGLGRLSLRSGFEGFAPDHARARQNLEEARRRVGHADLLILAVDGPDPEQNAALTDELQEALAAVPGLEWATASQTRRPLWDWVLLYAELDEVMELAELVELQLGYLRCRLTRRCREGDLRSDDEIRRDQRRLEGLIARLDERARRSLGPPPEGTAWPELASDDGTTALVVARLTAGAAETEAAAPSLGAVETVLSEGAARWLERGQRVRLIGPYCSEQELSVRRRDLGQRALLLSLLVFVGVLSVLADRLWSVVVVSAVTLVGLLWSFGAMGWLSIELDLLLLGAPSLPLGLTVCASISGGERRRRLEAIDSPEGVRALPLRPILQATLAVLTAAGLLQLAQSEGIRHYGGAMALSQLAMLLSLLLLQPVLGGSRASAAPSASALRRGLVAATEALRGHRGPGVLAATLLVSGALLWAGRPWPGFQQATEPLGPPTGCEAQGLPEILEPLATARGQWAVLLADDEGALDLARAAIAELGRDERLGRLVIPSMLIPGDQEEKLEEIDALRRLLESEVAARAPQEHQAALSKLSRAARVDEPSPSRAGRPGSSGS
jgi:hypothetical protein